jgi:hypothetical protein
VPGVAGLPVPACVNNISPIAVTDLSGFSLLPAAKECMVKHKLNAMISAAMFFIFPSSSLLIGYKAL